MRSDILKKHQKSRGCYINCHDHLSGVLWRWPRTEICFWYQSACWASVASRRWGWSVRRDVWFVLGKPRSVIVAGLNWKFPNNTPIGFLSKISQEENVFCLRMCERVGDAVVLVLVFQQRCNEESVRNLETDDILCIFMNTHSVVPFLNFLFIQPWRVLTSTYPKFESDLAVTQT